MLLAVRTSSSHAHGAGSSPLVSLIQHHGGTLPPAETRASFGTRPKQADYDRLLRRLEPGKEAVQVAVSFGEA